MRACDYSFQGSSRRCGPGPPIYPVRACGHVPWQPLLAAACGRLRLQWHRAHIGVCRASLADVVLDHPSISLLHAALYYEEGRSGAGGWPGAWHVADLGSAHGTFHTWPSDDERRVVQPPTKIVALVAFIHIIGARM